MKEWTLCPEAKKIVEELIEKFPAHFSGIDPMHINCVMCTGSRSASVLAKIYIIPDRFRCATGSPYRYVIEVYDNNWHDLDDAQKRAVIFHELMHIDPSLDPPKLVKHDVQDFRVLLETWGINYVENPPSLFDEEQED